MRHYELLFGIFSQILKLIFRLVIRIPFDRSEVPACFAAYKQDGQREANIIVG
jgi:hypothetical protein